MRIITTGIALVMTMATVADATQAVPDFSKTANPELVGELAKGLSISPTQAEGAAGALFGVAKQKLSPGDWGKVSGAVPGMDGLLKAAPMMAAAGGGGGAAAAAGLGGLAGAASAFSKLGLKPEMVAKAVPILTQYVSKAGGANLGALLAGALK